MKGLFLGVGILLLFFASGCTGRYLNEYSLAGAPAGGKAIYEDAEIKVAVSIIDDRKFGVDILNKTDHPLRITWGNSNVVDALGVGKRLVYTVSGSVSTDKDSITTIAPGASAVAEVYPADHVYVDKKGREQLYPLYFRGPASGRPEDLNDKPIGINLVAEVNDHTRAYPLMLNVRPSRYAGF